MGKNNFDVSFLPNGLRGLLIFPIMRSYMRQASLVEGVETESGGEVKDSEDSDDTKDLESIPLEALLFSSSCSAIL